MPGILLRIVSSTVVDVFQYNGISMKNKTKEEAYLEMLKPAETISFKVLNCADDLSAVRETPGDGFYIRSFE